MIQSRKIVTATTTVLAAACVLAPAANAAKLPDLSVSGLEVATPSVAQGQSVEVTATVRNAGRGSAPASVIGLYTSEDAKQGKGDERLAGTLKVKKLKKGKSFEATGDAKLPGAVGLGGYELIACADEKSKAKEKKEKNNCSPAESGVGVRAPASPVNVSPRLDESNADSQPLTASGGSPGVVGADGTTYTMIVPDGALTHDVSIKMTPLAGIEGLPLSGGMVAGVQIDGDELQLAKPAQLVISRDGLAPSPSQVAFGYHNGGGDFFLSPFGQRPAGYPPESIVVPVLHGGGYGIADASGGDVAAQRGKLPNRAEDWLAQSAASLGGSFRRGVAASARQGIDADSVRANARQIYEQVVGPQMKAAETNDAILDKAASDAFGWMRQLALVGLDSEFAAEFEQIMVSLEKALENAYQKAKERCITGDFTQVSKLLGLERFRQLLGFGEGTDVFADIGKCLRFELRVTSHVEVHENPGGGDYVDIVSELASAVPLNLTFDEGPIRLTGEAPFEYRFFSLDSRVTLGCQTGTSSPTGNLQNGQMVVLSGHVIAGDPGAPPGPPEVSMLIDPGLPQEEVQSQSSGCAGSFSDTAFEQNWKNQWTTWFHPPESVADNDGPWLIEGFTSAAAPTVGTKTFTETVGARTINETWEVVHTPDRS